MIDDDLSPFFVPGEFCHPDDTLGGSGVVGIFDAEYVRTGGGVGISDSRPAYRMPSATVPADPFGLVLQHKGVLYRVMDVEPNGTGESVLILENA